MTQPKRAIYPFAEMFEVDTNGTTSVNIWSIPIDTIITMVLCRVKVAAIDAGGANIIVGDTDDDNGYILAADICGTTVGTIYGDAITERGAYLNLGESATAPHAGPWKVYTAAGKTLTTVCSAALDTDGTVEIFVFGYRYIV